MLKTIPAAALIVGASAVAGGWFGQTAGPARDRVDERYQVYTAALAAIEQQY